MSTDEKKSLQAINGELVGTKQSNNEIRIGGTDVINLTGLSDSQINELKVMHAKGLIDIGKKAAELQVDVSALDKTLASFNDQTAKATEKDTHATVTHTQTSALGRTEIVMGNTDKARSGKLSRSARGESDNTLMIFGIIAVAAIVVALIVRG